MFNKVTLEKEICALLEKNGYKIEGVQAIHITLRLDEFPTLLLEYKDHLVEQPIEGKPIEIPDWGWWD